MNSDKVSGINPKDLVGASKPPLHCIPPVALIHLGLAMENGKNKYGLMNWRRHPVIASIYYDAILRHLMAWWDGDNVAADSQVHHLGHIMACCAILLDADQSDQLDDDRPIPGDVATFIETETEQRKQRAKQQAGLDRLKNAPTPWSDGVTGE